MNFKYKAIAAFAAFLLLFGLLARITQLQTRVYQTELAKDSVEAVNSKTITRIQGDLQVAQRRIVQTELEKDSLSIALKTQSKVRASLLVTIDSLKGHVQTVVQKTDSTFTAKFPETHQPPFTVNATVDANIVQGIATLDFAVKIDPFKVGLDIGCGLAFNDVRPATITLVTPSFVTVSVDTVKQSREVCSPKPATSIHVGSIKTDAKLLGIGAILGAVAHWYFNRGDK